MFGVGWIRPLLHQAASKGQVFVRWRETPLSKRLLWCALGAGLLLWPHLPLLSQQTGPVRSGLIFPYEGHAFFLELPRLGIQSPSDRESVSDLVLYENGVPLPRPHEMHAIIQDQGNGAYSHWGRFLFFASSDNSDPRSNGRAYTLQTSRTLLTCCKGALAKWPILGALIGPLTAAMGFLLLILPWTPLTNLPADRQIAWLRQRTLVLCSSLGVLGLVGWFLRANLLDVMMLPTRIGYALLALVLLFCFLLWSFWNWRTEKRQQFHRDLGPMPRLLAGAASLVVVLLWLLAAIEAGARVAPVIDSQSMNPACKYAWPDYFAARNSLGFHDREPGPKRGPRILLLGDSYTEGAGVPRQERFGERLEALLRADNPTAEVLNAGISGLDTFEEADVLDRVGDILQPDVVVVGYCLNDAEGESPPSKRAASWHQRFFLGQLRSYLYYRLLMSGYLVHGPDNWVEVLTEQHGDDSPGWHRVLKGLDRIAAWCARRHVQRVVLVFPLFEPDAEGYRAIMEKVTRTAQSKGFTSRNMLDDFDRRWAELAVSAYDGHPGREAQPIIARKLHELIGRPVMSYQAPPACPGHGR